MSASTSMHPSVTTATERQLTYAAAILEATDICLGDDPQVYLMGEGVPDPKGIFGTTTGLREKYGPRRVLDMPLSENGMTGVALGTCLGGMRPILTHQRVDFALYSMDQIVNHAAKWHFMFGGRAAVPMVIRMVIGRGWGQGPQHSQSLQAWFAHIPGLKVVMPTTAHDAKGLLIAGVEDDNPVIYLEHRWLHNVQGFVPEGRYSTPLGQAAVIRPGTDLTIVATSYMTLEALRAAEMIALSGASVEVVDVRTIRPLDEETILNSVGKTGRLLVSDTAGAFCGFSAEVVALAAEAGLGSRHCAPRRVTVPDYPSPCSPALAAGFYPRARDLARAAAEMLGLEGGAWFDPEPAGVHLDVPDSYFRGPF